MRRRIVLWAIVLIGLAIAVPAIAESTPAADEQAAREAFERGRARYDNGEFAEAAAAFEEAYRLSGRDALLYNLYLAHRDANQQEKAAEALRAFLVKVKHIENRAQLEARLKALDAGIAWERAQREEAQARAAAPKVTPAAVSQPPAPAPGPSERAHRLRLSGFALAGVGGAMLVGALATGLAANKREGELEDACDRDKRCVPGLEDTAARGERLAHTTDGLLFGGLAIAGASVVLIVLPRYAGERAPRVSALCDRAGCAARAVVRF